MATASRVIARLGWQPIVLAAVVAACPGCAQGDRSRAERVVPPRVVVVAPVLNLSGSQDLDALKVTDLIASEFLSFRNISVVPVNLTLAELERRGKRTVETAADAIDLSTALGADATVVVAITEYDPYTPPVVGMVMQWYDGAAATTSAGPAGDMPTVRSTAAEVLSAEPVAGPRWQVQRVFNAADEATCAEVREFADERETGDSPYGWRKYLQSQELYVRYCGWSMIRTMLRLDAKVRAAVEPNEAES